MSHQLLIILKKEVINKSFLDLVTDKRSNNLLEEVVVLEIQENVEFMAGVFVIVFVLFLLVLRCPISKEFPNVEVLRAVF
jgi:hypothetical protein